MGPNRPRLPLHELLLLGRTVFLAGQSTGGWVYAYDTGEGVLRRLTRLPEELRESNLGSPATAAGGKYFYLAGGFILGQSLDLSDRTIDSVYRLDLETLEWRRWGTLSEKRFAAAAAIEDGKLFVAGGKHYELFTVGTSSSTVEIPTSSVNVFSLENGSRQDAVLPFSTWKGTLAFDGERETFLFSEDLVYFGDLSMASPWPHGPAPTEGAVNGNWPPPFSFYFRGRRLGLLDRRDPSSPFERVGRPVRQGIPALLPAFAGKLPCRMHFGSLSLGSPASRPTRTPAEKTIEKRPPGNSGGRCCGKGEKLQSLFLHQHEGQEENHGDSGDDDPVIDPEKLGKGDFPVVVHLQECILEVREHLGIEGSTGDGAENAPEGIGPSLPKGAHGCPRAIAEKGPAHAEEKPSRYGSAQDGGFYGKLHQPLVVEEVRSDHADDDGGHHELQDGEILEAEGGKLLVVPEHLCPLEKNAEYHSGDQAETELEIDGVRDALERHENFIQMDNDLIKIHSVHPRKSFWPLWHLPRKSR